MSDKNKPHLPIGYWIKKADELLAERINEVQRSNGPDPDRMADSQYPLRIRI